MTAATQVRCVTCDRAMRPSRATVTEYPDTIASAAHGKCYTCYHVTRQPKDVHLRPTTDPVAELVRYLPGGGYQLVKGQVLRVNRRRFVMLLDNGHKRVFDRKEWFEVIE